MTRHRGRADATPDIAMLLRLHTSAYLLLLHLHRAARDDPSRLSPRVVAALSNGSACAAWLAEHRQELPHELLPEDSLFRYFANLLSSFFDTSFTLDFVEFEGRLIGSGVRRRKASGRSGMHVARSVIRLAIKHQLARDGVKITADLSDRLAGDPTLRVDALVATYAWELERRALGKSKGQVVHRIWRSLPASLRKSLSDEAVWLARTRLLDAAGSVSD